MNYKVIMYEFFEEFQRESKLYKAKDKINKKNKELANIKLSEKDNLKLRKGLEKLNDKYRELKSSGVADKEIVIWFKKVTTDLCKKGNLYFASHIAKLTHSSAKGTSIFHTKYDKNSTFVSSSSLKKKEFDIAQSNGALIKVSEFLIFLTKKGVINATSHKNIQRIFKVFANTKKDLEKWEKGFLLYFKDNNVPRTHHLLKQVYFPVGNSYHLLTPLSSSSFIQHIYNLKTNRDSYEIKKQRKNNLYSKNIDIVYPNMAILKITASSDAHRNVSPLNVYRKGQKYLFPSTPPQWKSSIKPPLNYTSLFRGEYERRVWKQTKELQEYLLKITDNKPNMYIRDNVRRNINLIIDTLFNYVAEIQNLKELRGWSQEEGRLKESHRLWLDPYYEDIAFQNKRETKEWQDEVCLDFGLWLNKKLEHKEMLFVKINSDRWAKILKGRLREFELDLEVLR